MLINWMKLATFERKAGDEVTAPWLMALEFVGDATDLKIEAEGKWTAMGSVLPASGPDGLPGLTLPEDQLIIKDCRFAALIGKIGGSSAIHFMPKEPAALIADQPFAVGSVCVLKVPTGTFGPLFLGFNAKARPVRIETLKATIWGARPTG